MTDRIWYAAYGSNLDRDRFLCYIHGGSPPGTSAVQRGCTDPTPPSEDRPSSIPHRIYFARSSPAWGGAVAFVDPERSEAETLTRMWLVTVEQFLEIAEQENAARPGTASLDLNALERAGRFSLLERGWYPLALHCGRTDGVLVVTITAPRPTHEPRSEPSAAYVQTITRGLRESHGLTDAEIDSYLLRALG